MSIPFSRGLHYRNVIVNEAFLKRHSTAKRRSTACQCAISEINACGRHWSSVARDARGTCRRQTQWRKEGAGEGGRPRAQPKEGAKYCVKRVENKEFCW